MRVLQHVLFWLAATAFFCAVFRYDFTPLQTLTNTVGFMPGHAIFVYSLIYILIPEYIFRGRLRAAIPVFLLILLVSLFYLRIADVYILHYSGHKNLWFLHSLPRSIFALFSIGWIAVSIKLVKYWFVEKEVQQKLEKEKLTAELQLLRSQLHPHFLFNTLNNLYSLTLERSAHAPQMILRLSSLLRYILYESNEATVPLAKEVGILRNYIGLEQLRYGDRLEVSLSFTGNMNDKRIAPLLLLPFLENCFKHGTSGQLDKCWICLQMHVGDGRLDLKLINSCHHAPVTKAGEPPAPGGLGLQNVRKRLGLLYPGTHTLKIIPEEETFTVSLNIPLYEPAAQAGPERPITPTINFYRETEMPPGR